MRQKPLDPFLADPEDWFFGKGAHMTLLAYLQCKQSPHSKVSMRRREVRRKERRQHAKAHDDKVQKPAEAGTKGQRNRKGNRAPRAGKPGGKASSAVAGPHASSPSGCHTGHGLNFYDPTIQQWISHWVNQYAHTNPAPRGGFPWALSFPTSFQWHHPW